MINMSAKHLDKLKKVDMEDWLCYSFQPGVVSVIVPTFNRADLICESLESVRNQSYRPIELIIVDDGSMDDTVNVVERFMKAENHAPDFSVRLIVKENEGAPIARNVGSEASVGEYIVYLDSDDILHPYKVESQVLALVNNHEWEFCYGPVVKLENSKIWPYGYRAIEWREAAIRQLEWPFFQTSGPMLRRSFLSKLGRWNVHLKSCQDWELHMRMVMIEPKFGWVQDAIVYYRSESDPKKRLSANQFKKPYRADIRGVKGYAEFLKSIAELVPDTLRRDRCFRAGMAWALIRSARTNYFVDVKSNAIVLAYLAKVWGSGTVVSPLVSVVDLAIIFRLTSFGMYLVTMMEWMFYKTQAVKRRLTPNLGWKAAR